MCLNVISLISFHWNDLENRERKTSESGWDWGTIVGQNWTNVNIHIFWKEYIITFPTNINVCLQRFAITLIFKYFQKSFKKWTPLWANKSPVHDVTRGAQNCLITYVSLVFSCKIDSAETCNLNINLNTVMIMITEVKCYQHNNITAGKQANRCIFYDSGSSHSSQFPHTGKVIFSNAASLVC